MTKKFEIRNSTAEFLTFVATGKEDGIQVLYKDETIRATQFRQWCTYVIRQFAVRGYIVDKKRMEKARLTIWQMKEAREYKQTELGLLPEGWEEAKLGI